MRFGSVVWHSVSNLTASETDSAHPPDPGQFTISRDHSTPKPLAVDYSVSGTATDGTDYNMLGGSITIPANATSVTVDLLPVNDDIVEQDETAILTLSTPGEGEYEINGSASATVTIQDNEPQVEVEATAYAAEQGPTGGRFTVYRSGDGDHGLSVSYGVAGTATPGDDYAPLSGSVYIPPGAYSADIIVNPVNDQIVEPPESVMVALSTPLPEANYLRGDPPVATINILDNDGQTVLNSITATDSAHPSRTATNPTQTELYVGQPDAGDASITLSDTYSSTESDPQQHILWQVTGAGASPASGNFESNPTIALSVAGGNRTFLVQAGVDTDQNGSLSAQEVSHQIDVYVVKIDDMFVWDYQDPANIVTVHDFVNDGNLYVMERPNGSAEIKIDVTGEPQTQGAARNVLWFVDGGAAGEITPKTTDNFGSADPVVTLTPPVQRSSSDGQYTVYVGFDDNANGVLESEEVDRFAHVYVLKVVKVEWSAINSPLDTNPHLNGGERIFPDKQSPTDTVARDIVDVKATVWPTPPQGTIIYFQSYDVDDPNAFVPGQPAAEQIDPNDTAAATHGLDNFGKTPGQRGTFFPPTIDYRASAPTDQFGVAKAQFQVTMQPGDNFRVAASLAGAELDKITDDTVTPDDNQVAGYAGRLSDMLTVWRHLWIERDAMTPATPAPIAVNIRAVSTNVIMQGRTFGVDVVRLDVSPVEDESVFEGGTLTIPSFGGKTITIYKNDSSLNGDTLEVPANSFTASELATIGAGQVPASMTDDDDLTVLGSAGAPRLASGGNVIFTAFGDAYILPVYADAFNKTVTIPFDVNQDDTEVLTELDDSEDMSSSDTFWHTLLVSCFQPKVSADADPDGTSSRIGINVPAEGAIYGTSPSNAAVGGFDESAIYLETIRDMTAAGTNISDEAHTVAHEIGHTGSHPEHSATGLLMAGAPRIINGLPNDHFDNEALLRFRRLIKW